MPARRKRKNDVVDPNKRKLTASGFSTGKTLSAAASSPVPGAVSRESAAAASNGALQSVASTPVPCTKCRGPATPQSKRQLSGRQQLESRKRAKLATPHRLPLYKDRWPAESRQEDRNHPEVIEKSAAIRERDSRLSTGYQRRQADLYGLSHDLQPAQGPPASSAAAPQPAIRDTAHRLALQPGPIAAIQQTADLLAHPLPALHEQPQQQQALADVEAGEGPLAELEEEALTQENPQALLEWDSRRISLAASTSGRAPQQTSYQRQPSAASLQHRFPETLQGPWINAATHSPAAVFAGSSAAASSAGAGRRGPAAVAALPPQRIQPPQLAPHDCPPSPGSSATARLSHAVPQMQTGGSGLQHGALPSLPQQLAGSCRPCPAALPSVQRAGFSRQRLAGMASSSGSQGASQPLGTQQPGLPATAAPRHEGLDNRPQAAEQQEPLQRYGSQPRSLPAAGAHQPAVRRQAAFPGGPRQQQAAGGAQLRHFAAPPAPAQEHVDAVPGQAAQQAPAAAPRDPWEGSLMPRQREGWQSPDPRRALEIMRALPLNEEQMAAATSNPELPKMIRAGAGTGKTTTIIGRIINYTLGKGISPWQILALTFTNKAAKELKDRLAVRGVQDVQVSTFHALCNTILADNHAKAGFTKRPLIWSSPAELKAVLAEAMRWASLTKGKKCIIEWLDLDEHCTKGSWDNLLAAVKEKDPRLFLKAEEEAGKVMSKSKAWLKQQEQERKEAEDNKELEDGEQVGMSPDKRGWKEATISRVYQLELIQKVYEALLKQHHPELWDEQYGKTAQARKKQAKKASSTEESFDYNFSPPGDMPPRPAITKTYKWLKRVKSRGLPPTAFAPIDQGLAYTNYQRLLREASAVDFDDLLLHVRDLLRDQAVLSKLQRRYMYMLIDEYQDSNPLQIEIVDALQAEAQRVTVVGDDYQAIYGFRGAQPDVFQKFIDVYDHPELQQPLQDNYRSRPAIVDTGVMVMDNARGILKKTLRATKEANQHKPQLWETGHPEQEAAVIVAEMKRLHKEDGVRYENMACLFRVFSPMKAQKTYEPLQKELLDKEVPYNIVKQTAFLDRAEVKDTLAYLRLMLNTRDDPAFKRVFNKPKRALGKKFWEELEAYQERKRQAAFYHDEPENSEEAAADCSLMQCCQEMLDASLLSNSHASGARKFVTFINKMRLNSLHWTPSQTLMHILVDSGYLAEYKKGQAKKHSHAEHNPLATCIIDPEDDNDSSLPFSYVPEEPVAEKASHDAGDGAEAAAEASQRDASDNSAAVAGGSQGAADQSGTGDADLVLNTELPAGPLKELLAMSRDFEDSYLPALDIDPATHRSSQEDSIGSETLLRMSERAVVEASPASAAEGLPHDMLLSLYASFKKGPLPLMGMLDRFSLCNEQDEVGKKPGVTICTIHAAKGLEWDVIFMPRLNQCYLPVKWRPESGPLATGTQRLDVPQGFNSFAILREWGGPNRPARQMTDLEKACMLHFEEERRLLHVAITRARERAYVTYVRCAFSIEKKQWFDTERSFFLSSIKPSMHFTVFAKDEDEAEAEREKRFPQRPPDWEELGFVGE